MRLALALPKDPADNGLGVIYRALVDDPEAVHLIIAEVDCSKTTVDHDSGDVAPTVRVRRVEVVRPGDLNEVGKAMTAAREHRDGGTLFDTPGGEDR